MLCDYVRADTKQMSEIVNRIAVAAAEASAAASSRRPAGLVFDYTPLVHRDTRLRGGLASHLGAAAACPRRRVHPELAPGPWRHLLSIGPVELPAGHASAAGNALLGNSSTAALLVRAV